jgi:hypothetical protein
VGLPSLAPAPHAPPATRSDRLLTTNVSSPYIVHPISIFQSRTNIGEVGPRTSSETSQMAEKVKSVAIEEAERLKALTADAVQSKAYLYPIQVR